LRFLPNIGNILQQWNYPIDVIIVGFSYQQVVDAPVIIEKLNEDPDFQKLQTMFSWLNNIAREVVFSPVGYVDTGLVPYMETLKRQIVDNTDLSKFRSPLWVRLFVLC
jgi:hypothetical protein